MGRGRCDMPQVPIGSGSCPGLAQEAVPKSRRGNRRSGDLAVALASRRASSPNAQQGQRPRPGASPSQRMKWPERISGDRRERAPLDPALMRPLPEAPPARPHLHGHLHCVCCGRRGRGRAGSGGGDAGLRAQAGARERPDVSAAAAYRAADTPPTPPTPGPSPEAQTHGTAPLSPEGPWGRPSAAA